MKWLNWRDACKFLSGIAFANSLMNFYLFVCQKSIPFMNHVIMDDALAQKAAVLLGLFGALFYLGFSTPLHREAAQTSQLIQTTKRDVIPLVKSAEHVA